MQMQICIYCVTTKGLDKLGCCVAYILEVILANKRHPNYENRKTNTSTLVGQ